jgi:formylglycine-generating enzyme required for sulfatase activity
MVLIPAGEENSTFWMDATEVTNAQFKEFVDFTHYVTEAEKTIDWEVMKATLPPGTESPPDSMLAAGSLVFRETETPVDLRNPAQWWAWTTGANWREPEGPGSSIAERMNHPVLHVSWNDALAYASWAGKRLPTEAEWEWAAYGGHPEYRYPWGDEPPELAAELANFWQGDFPYSNAVEDGFPGTAPAGSFPANDFGLYDMAGNVWEWCSDSDDDPQEPLAEKHVIKGGSFLCNDSYCSGYAIRNRMSSSKDSGFNHTGFRCVKDL